MSKAVNRWGRVLAVCCALQAIGSYLHAAERPNIVFIYTDDHLQIP